MLRIGICDDSREFLLQVQQLLDNWDSRPEHTAVEAFEDGDALIAAHQKTPFNMILLDVVMPLLNGIDAAKELRETDKGVKIVFLTSSAEYAVDSYAVKASNYLLKPLDPGKFYACMEELTAQIQSVSKSIVVKGIHATHRVALADISYIEAQGKHIIFSRRENPDIVSLEPLYFYENRLLIEDGFYKCHRSYIVNIHHIDSYSHKEIVMRSGYRVPISRSCQKEFEAVYFRTVFGKAGDDG